MAAPSPETNGRRSRQSGELDLAHSGEVRPSGTEHRRHSRRPDLQLGSENRPGQPIGDQGQRKWAQPDLFASAGSGSAPGPRQLTESEPIQPPAAAPNLDGRDAGMKLAWDATADGQKEASLDCIRHLCERLPLLTGDDYHQLASARGLSIRPKAIGNLWKVARREGWLEPTGQYVLTRRPRAHGRAIPVMRSLLFTSSTAKAS